VNALAGVLTTYEPDRSVYCSARQEWQITFDRFHEARGGELTAEVIVETSRQPHPGILSQTKLNLLSAQAHTTLSRSLQVKQDDLEWADVLTLLCHDAIQHYREGEPVVELHTVPDRQGTRWLYHPWIEYGGPTVLFADGGSGKSLFGLALAVAVAHGVNIFGGPAPARAPVLYLDWESDAETHAERLRAIEAGAGIYEAGDGLPILYRRQSASLAESTNALRRYIGQYEVGLMIVDSLALARGGEPESAETTLKLFNAARELRIPWLGIDHVTKNGAGSVGTTASPSKPFGSVFTPNAARLTWSMEKAEEGGDEAAVVVLQNRKSNNVKSLGRRAYGVEFVTGEGDALLSVHYESMDLNDVPGMFPRLGQAHQIDTILSENRGPMLVEDVQRALEASGVTMKAAQIRVILNRHKDKFVAIQDGRTMRWGRLASEGTYK